MKQTAAVSFNLQFLSSLRDRSEGSDISIFTQDASLSRFWTVLRPRADCCDINRNDDTLLILISLSFIERRSFNTELDGDDDEAAMMINLESNESIY